MSEFAKLIFGDENKKLIFEDLQPKLVFADEFKKLIFDLPVNKGYPYIYSMLLS